MLQLTQEQMEALVSPVRTEVLSTFIALHPLSVKEVAEKMGRSQRGLYYHVEMLEEVGLIRKAKAKRGQRRDQQTYEPAIMGLSVVKSFKDPKYHDKISRNVRTGLRLLDRHHRRLLEACMKQPQLLEQSIFVWGQVRLKPEILKEVLDRAQDLNDFVRKNTDPYGEKVLFMGCALPMQPKPADEKPTPRIG